MALSASPRAARRPAWPDLVEEQYGKVMDINLKSAFFGTQFAAKQFIAHGCGGFILNISSVH